MDRRNSGLNEVYVKICEDPSQMPGAGNVEKGPDCVLYRVSATELSQSSLTKKNNNKSNTVLFFFNFLFLLFFFCAYVGNCVWYLNRGSKKPRQEFSVPTIEKRPLINFRSLNNMQAVKSVWFIL